MLLLAALRRVALRLPGAAARRQGEVPGRLQQVVAGRPQAAAQALQAMQGLPVHLVFWVLVQQAATRGSSPLEAAGLQAPWAGRPLAHWEPQELEAGPRAAVDPGR